MQGRNIQEFKKERLVQEKVRQRKELHRKYGIEEKEEGIKRPEGIPEYEPEKDNKYHRKELWEIIEGKGLLKPHA